MFNDGTVIWRQRKSLMLGGLQEAGKLCFTGLDRIILESDEAGVQPKGSTLFEICGDGE